MSRTAAESQQLRELIITLRRQGLTTAKISACAHCCRSQVVYYLAQARKQGVELPETILDSRGHRHRTARPGVIRYPACRHCGHKPAGRPRGLCWTCFYTPEIRERYPSESRYAPAQATGKEAPPDVTGSRPLPKCPVTAWPGSEEKILALQARALAGESLWHPQDGVPDAEVA